MTEKQYYLQITVRHLSGEISVIDSAQRLSFDDAAKERESISDFVGKAFSEDVSGRLTIPTEDDGVAVLRLSALAMVDIKIKEVMES